MTEDTILITKEMNYFIAELGKDSTYGSTPLEAVGRLYVELARKGGVKVRVRYNMRNDVTNFHVSSLGIDPVIL